MPEPTSMLLPMLLGQSEADGPTMSQRLAALLADLPELLSSHVLLSVTAMTAALLVSLPLGVLASRSRRLESIILPVVGVAQTIPGLALLALMVPLLGLIGFWPAFLALTVYGMLPPLRNTIAGLRGVDRSVLEAARAMGMTESQSFRRVELPLAAPVILAGVRTATVWVVGTAVLATPVGAASLGEYIFSGLKLGDQQRIVFGCFFAAALAIVLDQLLGLIERGQRLQKPWVGGVGLAGLIGVLLLSLAPSLQALTEPRRLIIADKGFTEQYILSEMLRQHLADHGYDATKKTDMGSSQIFQALSRAQIDVYIDYTGTLWATRMKRDEPIPAQAMLREVERWAMDEHGVLCVGPMGFENAYCLSMRREHAQRLGIKGVGDLARHSDSMSIAGDYEFFGREEWAKLQDAYGLSFEKSVPMDSSLMYDGLRMGEVDVIVAYSTDGRIAEYDLTVLDEPKDALPPYDAVILVSPEAADDPRLVSALAELVGGIDNDAMRRANQRVDLDDNTPRSAAAELLKIARDNAEP